MISLDDIKFQWEEEKGTYKRRLIIYVDNMPLVSNLYDKQDIEKYIKIEIKNTVRYILN